MSEEDGGKVSKNYVGLGIGLGAAFGAVFGVVFGLTIFGK